MNETYMDSVLQIEILLNFMNTLFGKAIGMKRYHEADELHLIRKNLYYGEFQYDAVLKSLKEIDVRLNQCSYV